MKNAIVFVGCLALGVMALNVPVRAQRGERGPGNDRNVSPAEIQTMFDGMALLQAQEQLKLRDDQFSQFLSRFKALQEARRRYQAERGRIIQDLRRLTSDPKSDVMQLRDRLKALQDLEGRSPADIRKALDAIDQVLDVRQQAQFRAFEELMERRKIELVVRARQNNRARLRSGGQ
jgi:Spy/CpxP family protein refolding chaperone